MASQPKPLDYAAYLKTPEIKRRYDIVGLVVEVLSPGNTPKQVAQKLRDYAAIGVLEAWVADSKRRTIAVLHPAGGEFRQTAVYGAGGRLRSQVLPRLRLAVDQVFRR